MTASPPFVILSEAKNLFSRPKNTGPKILRRSAPQNDREGGKSAPQNDSIPLLSFRASPIVILSAAKNLPSRLKSSVPKILRRSAPQNDREWKNRPSE